LEELLRTSVVCSSSGVQVERASDIGSVTNFPLTRGLSQHHAGLLRYVVIKAIFPGFRHGWTDSPNFVIFYSRKLALKKGSWATAPMIQDGNPMRILGMPKPADERRALSLWKEWKTHDGLIHLLSCAVIILRILGFRSVRQL
jgi:hypothetical protein